MADEKPEYVSAGAMTELGLWNHLKDNHERVGGEGGNVWEVHSKAHTVECDHTHKVGG